MGFRGLSIVKNLSRRTAHKFGTHVRIDTLTLKKLNILTHPTPGGFRRLNCLARLALARERTPSISKLEIHFVLMYSGTSPYGHLTSKKTSPLQSPWLSPKLYSTVQITPCNKVTSALRSLLPSPVGDLNSEVPLYRPLSRRLCCIGLYRDVWIAAIASSRTRLATLTGVMCNTSQCELRSLRVNAGMLNVIRIVTYYTLPPLESPDSFWIAMAFSR